MADVVFLATVVAFFVLCAGYVAICGRIIGPDEINDVDTADDELASEVFFEEAA